MAATRLRRKTATSSLIAPIPDPQPASIPTLTTVPTTTSKPTAEKFKCPETTCTRSFRTIRERTSHVQEEHRKPVSIIQSAKSQNGGKIKKKVRLVIPVKQKKPQETECANCGEKIPTFVLPGHLKTCTSAEPKRFECSEQDCESVFKTCAERTTHIKRVHCQAIECPVPGCQAVMKEASMSRHLKTVHVGLTLACTNCRKKVLYGDLSAHLKICREPVKKNSAKISDRKTRKPVQEATKKAPAASKLNVPRENCGEQILKSQFKSHSDNCRPLIEESLFKCTERDCDTAFKTKASWRQHIRTVHALPIECPFVSCASLVKRASLAKHVKQLHEGGAGKCTNCGKRISRVSLTKHINSNPKDESQLFRCIKKQTVKGSSAAPKPKTRKTAKENQENQPPSTSDPGQQVVGPLKSVEYVEPVLQPRRGRGKRNLNTDLDSNPEPVASHLSYPVPPSNYEPPVKKSLINQIHQKFKGECEKCNKKMSYAKFCKHVCPNKEVTEKLKNKCIHCGKKVPPLRIQSHMASCASKAQLSVQSSETNDLNDQQKPGQQNSELQQVEISNNEPPIAVQDCLEDESDNANNELTEPVTVHTTFNSEGSYIDVDSIDSPNGSLSSVMIAVPEDNSDSASDISEESFSQRFNDTIVLLSDTDCSTNRSSLGASFVFHLSDDEEENDNEIEIVFINVAGLNRQRE